MCNKNIAIQWTQSKFKSFVKQAYKDDFNLFISKCFSTINPGNVYQHNWHIELLADYLSAVSRGEMTRLIINLPPRSLKSMCVSVAWPAFLLGKNPAERIIVGSYASQLGLKHSMDCRMILQSSWYKTLFPEVTLSNEQNEKHKFLTTQRGFRLAASVGGALTGEGGGILIVDDPLNPNQAYRKVTRTLANRWFDNTLLSRLDNKANGSIVVVMQRLHEEDLTGHLLKKGGEWQHLSIPALAEKNTHYQFGDTLFLHEKGTPIHPQRDSAEVLQRVKAEMGSHAFSAQYQQSPILSEEGLIKLSWFKRYSAVPEGQIVQSWDTAVKTGKHNDYSVCVTLCLSDNHYYLVDVMRKRLDYVGLREAIKVQYSIWNPKAVLVEDKASGMAVNQELFVNTQLPVIPIQVKKDKITRCMEILGLIESGKVLLPKQAPWLVDFEMELGTFPFGAHDDQLDALSQALNWMKKRNVHPYKIRRL